MNYRLAERREPLRPAPEHRRRRALPARHDGPLQRQAHTSRWPPTTPAPARSTATAASPLPGDHRVHRARHEILPALQELVTRRIRLRSDWRVAVRVGFPAATDAVPMDALARSA
ncbi:MAG: hypothetical protein MZV70_56365 [Desulfobacterales bacterium]|nr:hypothetical protein [Desulfobacterales bacterium]